MWVWWLAACAVDDADDVILVPGPELRVVPEVFDFGAVEPGEEYRISGFLYNEGEVPLGVRSDGFGDGSAFAGWLEPGNAVGSEGEDLELDPDRPVLPAGAQMPYTMLFRPDAGGWFTGELRIETFGDGVDDWADPRRDDLLVLVEGQSPGGELYAAWPAIAGQVVLTESAELASAFVPVSNRGTAPFVLTGASGDCAPGLHLVDRAYPATIDPGATIALEVARYGGEGRRCDITATTDVEGVPTLQAEVTVVDECGGNAAPEVVIVSPTEPLHVELVEDFVTLELRVSDADDAEDRLSCKISSAAAGSLVGCNATGPGRYSVEVPIAGIASGPGTDTLVVGVTDDCGLRRIASIPIVFGAWPDADADLDGYVKPDDCSDADPTVYPDAAEIADGLDNDCDGRRDESTDRADDDGDGISEIDGDCDDNDAEVYAGAPEKQNDRDDDCDGVRDEGTSVSDDDGDGWSEQQSDCDDADPDVAPASPELCGNGKDDDCDGLRDSADSCVSALIPLRLTSVQLSQTAAGPGEHVFARVLALGDAESIVWSASGGVLDVAEGEMARWTASNAGEYLLTATATAPDGTVVSATETISVVDDGFAVEVREQSVSATGCATAPADGGAILAVLALFTRRRR